MEIRHVWLAFISTFQDNLLNKLAFVHLFCLFMTSGISKVNLSRPFSIFITLVNENCTITLVQAGVQANEFASLIDYAGN